MERFAGNLRLDVRGRFQDTADGIALYDMVSTAHLQFPPPGRLFMASLARRRRLQMGNPEDGQASTQLGVRPAQKASRVPAVQRFIH